MFVFSCAESMVDDVPVWCGGALFLLLRPLPRTRTLLKEKEVPGYDRSMYTCERTAAKTRDGVEVRLTSSACDYRGHWDSNDLTEMRCDVLSVSGAMRVVCSSNAAASTVEVHCASRDYNDFVRAAPVIGRTAS